MKLCSEFNKVSTPLTLAICSLFWNVSWTLTLGRNNAFSTELKEKLYRQKPNSYIWSLAMEPCNVDFAVQQFQPNCQTYTDNGTCILFQLADPLGWEKCQQCPCLSPAKLMKNMCLKINEKN